LQNYSIRAGLSLPPGTIKPCFTDNGNETITDNNTGLVWMRCIMSNVPGVPRTGTWCVDTTIGTYPFCDTASNDCNGGNALGAYGHFVGGSNENSNTIWRACNLANSNPSGGMGGRNNWRVPTLSELQSIIDYEGAVNQSGLAGKPYREYFPMGSGSGEYNFFQWTSSTFAVGTTLSYRIWTTKFAVGTTLSYRIFGTTGAVESQSKTTAHAVRCVSN
jgi:hypothetical protein